ncbi:CopD family protein [Streptomyces sp. NPDC002221]|uniref:CopD family protein n=1 Tax=Streptomyces sp. NPDC002221 TaxID=3364639 RepID=UPI00369B3113
MTTAHDETERKGPDEATGSVPEEQPSTSETRGKVSGAELDERFAGWTMRQRERLRHSPEDSARLIRRSVTAVTGIGILVLAVATGVTGENFKVSTADNEARITQLKQQVDTAQSTPVKTDAGAQLSHLTEAAADAQKVAAGEQAFATLYHQAGVQPDPHNGTPNQAALEIIRHRRDMAPLFSKDSFLVSDEDVDGTSSLTPFDSHTEIDPRYAWYIRYDGQNAAAPSTYTWKVETVMPDLSVKSGSGATNQAEAVWLCRDTKTSEILAWASARYVRNGTAGAFNRLALVVTAAGAQYENPAIKMPTGSAPPEPSGTGAQGMGGKR